MMRHPLSPHHQSDFYGPDSVTWKVAREWAVLLGGTRAILMQIAHPLVAQGVSDHTNYLADPYGRALRTLLRGEELAFGSVSIAHQSARTINTLHKQVHGTLLMDAGRFAKGTRYDARDPELLLWVQATLIDTVLQCYELFVRPLSQAEQNQYYQESKRSGHLLGLLPSQMPEGIDDLKHYIHKMLHSDQLAPTLAGRAIAFHTLFPPAPSALRPLMHFNRWVTNALLPQPVREIYGFEWSTSQQHAFTLSARSMRLVIPRLPMFFRELPLTRHLMRGEYHRQ